jgi:hypothetical protein
MKQQVTDFALLPLDFRNELLFLASNTPHYVKVTIRHGGKFVCHFSSGLALCTACKQATNACFFKFSARETNLRKSANLEGKVQRKLLV